MKKLISLVALLLLISIKTYANETPQEYAVRLSNNSELVNQLWKECETASNQVHCFWIGMSIAKAESYRQWGDHWYFWMVTSNDKSIERWVTSYNKYRYKAQDWYFFYWDKGSLGKSRYCTSEVSSNSKVGCPNGRKNFDSFYSEYSKLFLQTQSIKETKNVQKLKVKKICKQLWTVQKDEYIQIDSRLWIFKQWIKNLTIKDKIFICRDV